MSHFKSLKKPASKEASRDIFDGFWLLISAWAGLLLLLVLVAIVTKKKKNPESSNYSYNTSRRRSRPFVYPASIHKYWFKARHNVPFGLASKNWQSLRIYGTSTTSFGFSSPEQFALYRKIKISRLSMNSLQNSLQRLPNNELLT